MLSSSSFLFFALVASAFICSTQGQNPPIRSYITEQYYTTTDCANSSVVAHVSYIIDNCFSTSNSNPPSFNFDETNYYSYDTSENCTGSPSSTTSALYACGSATQQASTKVIYTPNGSNLKIAGAATTALYLRGPDTAGNLCNPASIYSVKIDVCFAPIRSTNSYIFSCQDDGTAQITVYELHDCSGAPASIMPVGLDSCNAAGYEILAGDDNVCGLVASTSVLTTAAVTTGASSSSTGATAATGTSSTGAAASGNPTTTTARTAATGGNSNEASSPIMMSAFVILATIIASSLLL
eukprot:TRINITY_DN15832_c0_g1_i3.p1 TRINITY_DN15832_c0_g1~~TRINITY_DN15832_c0_g1_i3.p1  ORF type:complete len:296 (-),score=68.41 TRINITY_DN15832_c0_g1_i3:41-928(-)